MHTRCISMLYNFTCNKLQTIACLCSRSALCLWHQLRQELQLDREQSRVCAPLLWLRDKPQSIPHVGISMSRWSNNENGEKIFFLLFSPLCQEGSKRWKKGNANYFQVKWRDSLFDKVKIWMSHYYSANCKKVMAVTDYIQARMEL